MKFLIVKTSSIGDIIQAFPVLEYLKERYPDAVIDWVVEKEYQNLVESHPAVRHTIALSTRTWRKAILPFSTWKEVVGFSKQLRLEKYDILFDLQGNTKSAFITALAKADEKVGMGWRSVPEILNIFATRKHIEMEKSLPIQHRYLQLVQRFFSDTESFFPKGVALRLSSEEEHRLQSLLASGTPRVMIAGGSRWSNKQLSEKTLRDLLNQIVQQDDPYFYFIGGSPQEKIAADELHATFPRSCSIGALSFPLWQALMREMNLVIAVDSAALALCGTTSTPSLSFFGPSLAAVYKPLGAHHVAWQGSCPYGLNFKTRCPRLRSCKTGACLKSASADVLFGSYSLKKSKLM